MFVPPMKLLVFAHTPPPHHGQSYMVKLMLDGFGGDRRKSAIRNPQPSGARQTAEGSPQGEAGGPNQSAIECYHVNARFSEDMEDIGAFRFEKAMLVLRYCIEAIWCRFRYGIDAFYYVPAPGKRAALYRDWIVMLLCRPFFRHFIHHWHAVGLGDWLQHEGTWLERSLTHWLLGRPALGIALAIPSMRDALWFRTGRVEIVANGIPDPCPDFDSAVLPRRLARLAARLALLAGIAPTDAVRTAAGGDPEIFRVLYLAHCTREKGIFDTLDAVALVNARLAATHSPLRVQLTVAGLFVRDTEEAEFQARAALPDLAGAVRYAGFIGGGEKAALLRDSDCLCFPSYYHAESFGLVVVEAMAAGMSVITTRWRALPELLPADYPGFVPVRAPAAVAQALVEAPAWDATALRPEFLAHFTEQQHLKVLRDAMQSLARPALSAA